MNGVWTSTEDMTIVNTLAAFSWSGIYCFVCQSWWWILYKADVGADLVGK
jgi:hypothetical protein